MATVKRRAAAADKPQGTSCHTFRATAITAYLSNGGTLEHAQQIAAHASPTATQLYDRTADTISSMKSSASCDLGCQAMRAHAMSLRRRILPPRRLPRSVRIVGGRVICAAILAGGTGAAFAQGPRRVPTVLVIATGGTIAGEQAQPGTFGTYAVKKRVSDLVALVPNLPQYAEVEMEQFSNISSPAITPADWLQLAQRINQRLTERPDLAGVVVTHGTSRQEETAFFLHLTIRSDRPVVVVARSDHRPGSAQMGRSICSRRSVWRRRRSRAGKGSRS